MFRIVSFMNVCGVAALTALVGAIGLTAQEGPVIDPNGVVNAASFRPVDFPGSELAPGSLISIFGRGLGPQAGVQAAQFPLPEELGPTRTRVRVNDQFVCRLLYVSDTQINCQLPGGIAGDRIRVRVLTTQGQSGEVEVPFGPNGCGLFTRALNGRGPLLAQNFEDAPNPQNRFRLNAGDNSARPGQVMVLWGTGLGNTTPPVVAGEPASGLTPAADPPEVFVGGVRAEVQYAGRAPGYAGLDQIQFVVPPEAPEGCATPVLLRQRDRTSNIGTVAVNRNGGWCRDAFETIVPGESFGQIVLASGLGRLGRGQLGSSTGFGGPYPPASSTHPGMHGGPGGGVMAGPGGVGPNGIGPFGMHPGIPLFAGGTAMNGFGPGQGNRQGSPQGMGPGGMNQGAASAGPNVALAQFVRLGADADLDVGIPPAATNSCNSYPLGPYGVLDLMRGPVELLDAGQLAIEGPGVNLILSPIQTANGPVYMGALPGPLEQGRYSAAGLGGPDVGSFGSVLLSVPPLLTVTDSLAAGAQISRSQGLTINWTGGTASDLVVIHGRTFLIPPGVTRPIRDPMSYRSQAFVCTTTAGAMRFRVPSSVLDLLPEGLLTLNVTHMPSATGIARFQASGLDVGGVFRWLDTTTFLDLELVP